PSAVVNWQNFFKPAPDAKERGLLEKRLGTWTDTDDAADLVKRGRAELALGKLVAAETSFRQALRLQDDNRDAKLELAALYLRKNEVPRAFELLADVRDVIGYSDDISQTFLLKYRYTLALGYLARGDRP